ncbi:uncharacterized protein KIAA2012 homolog isoform X2 [Cavia porcellus]|uniref:uncharacterized protein KIAA2012 homolog isoform X2 n=1 Tax=Cavia porcellus TaxID=10141 RepID=UPI000C87B1AA|nr:uncharacterized protein KIAA2012 homolog isoform X2 [Cavia porcellus]
MLALSLLSRGHGKLVQSKQRLEVYFEPEDYLNWKSPEDYVLVSRPQDGHSAEQHSWSLFLPKTFSTRKGALILYSEGLAIPAWTPRERRKDVSRPTGHRERLALELHTLQDLQEAILAYGRTQRQQGHTWQPYLYFRRQSESQAQRQIQPGYSAKRYLRGFLRTWSPDATYRLHRAGYIKDSVLLQDTRPSMPKYLRFQQDLSGAPPRYQLLPVFPPFWIQQGKSFQQGEQGPDEGEAVAAGHMHQGSPAKCQGGQGTPLLPHREAGTQAEDTSAEGGPPVHASEKSHSEETRRPRRKALGQAHISPPWLLGDKSNPAPHAGTFPSRTADLSHKKGTKERCKARGSHLFPELPAERHLFPLVASVTASKHSSPGEAKEKKAPKALKLPPILEEPPRILDPLSSQFKVNEPPTELFIIPMEIHFHTPHPPKEKACKRGPELPLRRLHEQDLLGRPRPRAIHVRLPVPPDDALSEDAAPSLGPLPPITGKTSLESQGSPGTPGRGEMPPSAQHTQAPAAGPVYESVQSNVIPEEEGACVQHLQEANAASGTGLPRHLRGSSPLTRTAEKQGSPPSLEAKAQKVGTPQSSMDEEPRWLDRRALHVDMMPLLQVQHSLCSWGSHRQSASGFQGQAQGAQRRTAGSLSGPELCRARSQHFHLWIFLFCLAQESGEDQDSHEDQEEAPGENDRDGSQEPEPGCVPHTHTSAALAGHIQTLKTGTMENTGGGAGAPRLHSGLPGPAPEPPAPLSPRAEPGPTERKQRARRSPAGAPAEKELTDKTKRKKKAEAEKSRKPAGQTAGPEPGTRVADPAEGRSEDAKAQRKSAPIARGGSPGARRRRKAELGGPNCTGSEGSEGAPSGDLLPARPGASKVSVDATSATTQEKAARDRLHALKAERRLQEVVKRRRAQDEQRRGQQEPLEGEEAAGLRQRLSEEPSSRRPSLEERRPQEEAAAERRRAAQDRARLQREELRRALQEAQRRRQQEMAARAEAEKQRQKELEIQAAAEEHKHLAEMAKEEQPDFQWQRQVAEKALLQDEERRQQEAAARPALEDADEQAQEQASISQLKLNPRTTCPKGFSQTSSCSSSESSSTI